MSGRDKQTFDMMRRQAALALSQKTGKKYESRIVRSIMKLDPANNSRDFKFFADAEKPGASDYANYNKGAIISTPTGLISNVFAEISAPDLKPIPYQAGTNAYDTYYEIGRIINSFELTLQKDNRKRKDILLSEIHRPLPEIIPAFQKGNVVDTVIPAAVIGNGETRPMILNMEAEKTSTIEILGKLPNGSPQLSNVVQDFLMALYLEILEEDN